MTTLNINKEERLFTNLVSNFYWIKSKAQVKKSKSLAKKSALKLRLKGTSTPAIPKPSVPKDTDKVANLIDKLRCLNLNAPGYASVRFLHFTNFSQITKRTGTRCISMAFSK